MIKVFRGVALLLGVLAVTHTARAQSNPPSADLALTYTTERAKVASMDCGCFWLQGGSVDGAVPLLRSLSLAAELTGEHSANITPGVDLSKIAFMAGPRYVFDTSRFKRRISLFGESLFGVAHGFDSSFSTRSGFQNSANSLSLQFGGGVNAAISRSFSVRVIELDYVRTRFRNLASNSQDDFRLAVGIVYHAGRR
jgi:hypothetical protein